MTHSRLQDEGAESEQKAGLREFQRLSLLIAAGWAGTNLGLAVADLPLKFVLKEQVGLGAAGVAGFLAIGQFTNYIKPLAGVLTDSVPLFGTRRRHYLLLSLLGTGLFWLLLAFVPRTRDAMLLTYTVLYVTVVFTSTTLGGVMVEVGNRFRAAGRLTAQRIGMFRVGSLGGGLVGGYLAQLPFIVPAALCAALHLLLVPMYYRNLPEEKQHGVNRQAWREAGRQFRTLLDSKILLAAAGMVALIAASPGFGTPLLFQQSDQLHFAKPFIGFLGLISAATGLAASAFYYAACRKMPLQSLISSSIVVHALGTLAYLYYHSEASAIVVSAISGVTVTLATLPVYDLAARATPKGSEALGYSVMMSVWNLTNALSDWSGSLLFDRFHLTFINLVWLNAGTTLLALIAVPFLPVALLRLRDGADTGS
jgi:predicted MFS family arabinose efflux permease